MDVENKGSREGKGKGRKGKEREETEEEAWKIEKKKRRFRMRALEKTMERGVRGRGRGGSMGKSKKQKTATGKNTKETALVEHKNKFKKLNKQVKTQAENKGKKRGGKPEDRERKVTKRHLNVRRK